MGVRRETELKFDLDTSAVGPFKRWARESMAYAPGNTKRLLSVYYDTRKHALRRRGLSLRIRQEGERRIQTLKANGRSGAGVFERPEWERVLPDGDASLADFGDPEADAMLGKLDRLAPIFEIRFDRTAWMLTEGSSTIEVAVDHGIISHGEATRSISELELELKDGSTADLFRLARRLAEVGRIRLGAQTKSERGYELIASEAKSGIRSEPVTLDRRMSAAEAFQAVARNCLRHFRLNETALVGTRAVDALHQARVAIRRLRSALSLFSGIVADDEVGRIKAELRSLSGLLGVARNVDVYRARVLEALPAPDEGERGNELVARLEGERERAYDAVIRKLGSKRFRLFAIDLAAWIEGGAWLSRTDPSGAREESAEVFAASVLDRTWRKIRKKGRRLDKADAPARHRVRIEAKKLRYASEFFGGLISGAKAKRRHKKFRSACELVQARLGELNDIATGHELSERLLQATGPSSETSSLSGLEAVRNEEAALVAAAVQAYDELAEAKPFWR